MPIDNIPYYSWGALILPFAEQRPLSDQLDVGRVWLSQAVNSATLAPLLRTNLDALYRCPSSTGPNLNSERGLAATWVAAPPGVPEQFATSNYVAANSSWRLDGTGGAPLNNGAFIEDHCRRFAEITDGLSNTLGISERRWQVKKDVNGLQVVGAALIFGVGRRWNSGDPTSADDLADALFQGETKINRKLDNTNSANRLGASSEHPGGANICLLDGSVRFIAETIEGDFNSFDLLDNSDMSSTWERLIGIQDGQPVTVP